MTVAAPRPPAAPAARPGTAVPPTGGAVPAAGGVGVVERLLHDVDRLPGRQPVLLRVAQLVDDPDSSTRDLAELCGADPAFTARLLRLANSAYYGRAGSVTSLVPALGVVGRTTLRTTALAMALGLSGEHGRLPDGFWARAGMVAASAQLAARDLGAPPGDALCAGLLCDLGQALLSRAAPAAYGALLARAADDDALVEAERAWCGLSHAELAGQVLRASGVPAGLCTAIEQHHDPAPGRRAAGRRRPGGGAGGVRRRHPGRAAGAPHGRPGPGVRRPAAGPRGGGGSGGAQQRARLIRPARGPS